MPTPITRQFCVTITGPPQQATDLENGLRRFIDGQVQRASPSTQVTVGIVGNNETRCAESVLNTRIEDIPGFANDQHLVGALRRCGVLTIGELTARSERGVWHINGIGKQRLSTIKKVLETYNLSLVQP